jgi:hypothetical protein
MSVLPPYSDPCAKRCRPGGRYTGQDIPIDETLGGNLMNTTASLMKLAFSAMSGQGDIFTDAPECAGAVAAAENLQVLAAAIMPT